MADKILLIKTKEIINGFDYDGVVFGECEQLPGDSNSIDLPQIFGISDKLGMISGVTVVYCVETKKDETYIGAVFRNAEVYKQGQYYDISMTGYYIKADSDNVFVIPEGKRKFKVLMSKNYLYVSNENISLYINEISKDEFCVKFDDSIVREGMKEAGNDTDKLKELFNTVFFEKYQTRKAEPIIKKLRSLCNDAKTTDYYATFLQYSSKPAEALKLFTSLLNKNPDDYDYLLIRMAQCNWDMGFNTETMMLLEKVKDKSRIKDFGMDYEWMKKSMPYISNAEYIENREILKYAVSLPFDDIPLPDTVKVDGVKKYFDPIRRKGVPITPEEKVRQQVLRYLIDVCHIPEEYITSEDSLAHYDKGDIRRADITVKINGRTLLLVECKENNIGIDGNPLHQILGYNKTARSRYLLLTNGICSYIYLSDDECNLKPLSELPDFDGMCKSAGMSVPIKNITSKRPDVSEFTHEEIQNYKNDGQYLGMDTPETLAPLVLNLAWFFLDSTYRMENIEGYGCKVIKDLGAINTVVSNASGGTFPGQYRQLLVRDRFGKEQMLCFSVFGVLSGYTSLVCPIEINGHLITKLEIRLDKCFSKVYGNKYILEHNGVRSRKTIASMMDYVRKTCPQLIRNDKVFLGEFDNSQNITIDSPGAKDFMARLIAYVILRKELSLIEADEK